MPATTHTLGPWTTDSLGEFGFVNVRPEDRTQPPLAFAGSARRSKAENEANARLMAAAPELLVRLCNLVDMAVACEGGRNHVVATVHVNEARALIARINKRGA